MRYKQETEEEDGWTRDIQPATMEHNGHHYKMACCDCGLIHDMAFWIEVDDEPPLVPRVRFKVRRNNRATAAMRAHMRKRKAKEESTK